MPTSSARISAQCSNPHSALRQSSIAFDDFLRTGVFDAVEDVLDRYDLIVSPTLAVPPVRNATDGNTRGPTEINGESVDPLIGWCMTYPINYTGHPAISVPAGFTADGLPVGLQIIGRRYADESVLTMAAAVERMRPWFNSYPGLRHIRAARSH